MTLIAKQTAHPALRDLKTLSREILALECRVRTLILDLEAFGFTAGVGWITDKQGDLGLRVSVFCHGFYGPDWQNKWNPRLWDHYRQKYRAQFVGKSRWTDSDCVCEQITALELWFEQNHKVRLNLMVGDNIILSTPEI